MKALATKFLTLLSMLSLVACNIDAPYEETISDFGIISDIRSKSEFFIETEQNGLIFSSQTAKNVSTGEEPDTESDEGKRIHVTYTILVDSGSDSFPADETKIISMSFAPLQVAKTREQITAMPEAEKEEFEANLGDSQILWNSYVNIYRNILNIAFIVPVNKVTPNGNFTLIEERSEELVLENDALGEGNKVLAEKGETVIVLTYRAHYKPEGTTTQTYRSTYASFPLPPFIDHNNDIRVFKFVINYKDEQSGGREKSIPPFYIDYSTDSPPTPPTPER